jgi:hypothetical protein
MVKIKLKVNILTIFPYPSDSIYFITPIIASYNQIYFFYKANRNILGSYTIIKHLSIIEFFL